jgi:RimJ/RimL family protein N-acetyltransferase
MGLPALTGRLAALREPTVDDAAALLDLLLTSDATRFGLDEPLSDLAIRRLVHRWVNERQSGQAFTFAIIKTESRALVGLIQVRQLDPEFSGAQWECTIAPAARGTGIFIEAARLVGSFSFDSVGAYRLEARARLQNGRANGALRKLGAVQEGVLRGSMEAGGENGDQVLWSTLKDDWGHHGVPTGARVH